jgi:CRISPR-associated protein Cas1
MTGEEPIPISLVAHTVFCDRRAWLEAAGEEIPSVAIEHGVADHRRVDARVDERAARRRSVGVAHPDLGLTGRCDVVDVGENGLEIVEFKSSPVRRSSAVTRAQVIQLALQRLCLESTGHNVVGQAVHFTTQRRTVDVKLTEADVAEAIEYVARTRAIVEARHAPAPLVDDPRCGGCSHASICLPDERAGQPVTRRIAVPDPHGEVLHVTTPGTRVSLRAGRLVISHQGEQVRSLPVERVHALTLHGNADVSSAAMRELLWRQRAVLWCSGRGWLIGYALSSDGPNGLARVNQHVASANGDLGLAAELVSAKIANQATLLRRRRLPSGRPPPRTEPRRQTASRSSPPPRSRG